MSGSQAPGRRGALAIVLHTHMPYVEGFGTWPSGEEWLWEAIAGCYLPLLELLEQGAPLTLSLTPVLCDQLEAPGLGERFEAFIEQVRRETHAEDAAGLRAAGEQRLADELDRSWGDYLRALELFRRQGGDLLRAFAPYAQWTSSATHAVLPLLATDAGVAEQVRTGLRSHRRRFGGAAWRGGFWLPECGWAPWIDRRLQAEGLASACVELTGALGLAAPAHLRPLHTGSGLVLAPIDRHTISLVWSAGGYPAAASYRDYHHHTIHHHNPWNNAGDPYERDVAFALAREHARDFVARTLRRLQDAPPGGGLVTCALDTELLGHWWFEGLEWLRAVLAECERQGLPLLRLDDALERFEPVPLEEAPGEDRAPLPEAIAAPSTWGSEGDLSTWSGPAAGELAFAARAGELAVLAAGRSAPLGAVRELLALQASDWPFMVTRGLAGPYPLERFSGHRERLAAALAGAGAGSAPAAASAPAAGPAPAIRNLAVDADGAALLEP
ncbi:MAG: 1,4-alpha-glucan branching protein domain-containing protein [Solirubrobacteraceae bacterium]